jgi:hypothetical protein
MAGRGSTADVGPGDYEEKGFAEVAVRRARGGAGTGVSGPQLSNGDFLSSEPRFPERSWEGAVKRRPGPASYFQPVVGPSETETKGSSGLPVGSLQGISAAAAAQRPLPHAANASALGWRPATVPGSAASYQQVRTLAQRRHRALRSPISHLPSPPACLSSRALPVRLALSFFLSFFLPVCLAF